MKNLFGLQSSVKRILPTGKPETNTSLRYRVLRGEVFSFQVGYRLGGLAEVTCSLDGAAAQWSTIRRIGLVPLYRPTNNTPRKTLESTAPCFVPDVLWPWNGEPVFAHKGVAGGFWVTVRVPEDIAAGKVVLRVRLQVGGRETFSGKVTLNVMSQRQGEIPPIPVTHWFYCDALMDWYGLEPWQPRLWTVIERFMRSMREHGSNTILTPTITPSLDGEKRPHQLVGIIDKGDDTYAFDLSNLKRWLRLVKRVGFDYVELAHLVTQWGCRHAPAIYGSRDGKEVRLFDRQESAWGDRYRRFLEQFLPAVVECCQQLGYRNRTVLHISDEPHTDHLENYTRVREMLREIDPHLHFTDALSSIEFLKEGIVDNPVPSIRVADEFMDAAERPTWVYFCCNPQGRFINRFLDYSLNRYRMLGWMLWKKRAEGFLHWGFNYWYVSKTRELLDPFVETDGRCPSWNPGDTSLVYPGDEAPIESIRHEVFRESMQDLALLRWAEVGGLDLSKLTKPLKAWDDYPRGDLWTEQSRQELIKMICG